MIRKEISVEVKSSVEKVYAFLDDVSNTPKWIQRCKENRKVSSGPMAVGSKLHYTYKEGSRTGEMDGVVTKHEPNKQLTMQFNDKMFEVEIDFRVSPSATGTELKHAIAIKPKALIGKLFSPIIRFALPKQTERDIGRLKALLEQ